MLKTALGLLPLLLAHGLAVAAPDFEGKVEALGVGRIELLATDMPPDWMKQGQVVQAFGWNAQVQQVSGKQVSLTLDATKTKNVKVGDAVNIRAPASDEPQMCGG